MPLPSKLATCTPFHTSVIIKTCLEVHSADLGFEPLIPEHLKTLFNIVEERFKKLLNFDV